MRVIILFFILTFCIFVSLDSQTISAQTNSIVQNSLPKMFNAANIQSNVYNDTIHNFSILPPDGWSVVSQTNGTNDALVTFSNQNPQSLANFGIYYSHVNPIPQSIIALPNDEILNQSTTKLFDTSQFTILQKNIERFSDGFVIQVISEPKQNTQNTPISEWFLFWLDDGRQYYLILTSSQNGFGQNQVAFERSAYTFYVGPEKVPTVPEFGPVTITVFTIMISATLILLKVRKFRL
ncbi:MAG: hypothetical protein ACREA3_07420 [Nitrosotalea sp.]